MIHNFLKTETTKMSKLNQWKWVTFMLCKMGTRKQHWTTISTGKWFQIIWMQHPKLEWENGHNIKADTVKSYICYCGRGVRLNGQDKKKHKKNKMKKKRRYKIKLKEKKIWPEWKIKTNRIMFRRSVFVCFQIISLDVENVL